MTEEQYKEMLAAMAKRVEEHPDLAEAWRDLAQAKMMGGDFDGAIDDCIESLSRSGINHSKGNRK